MPALIREGYTSFKISTAYDDIKLNDCEIIEVFALPKRENAINSSMLADLHCHLPADGRMDRLYFSIKAKTSGGVQFRMRSKVKVRRAQESSLLRSCRENPVRPDSVEEACLAKIDPKTWKSVLTKS